MAFKDFTGAGIGETPETEEDFRKLRTPGVLEGQVRSAGKEAGSALLQPEGLATAALGSWALGPVGILVGIGAGIIAKRMRQSELDRAAATAGEQQARFSEMDQQHAAAIQSSQGLAATDMDRKQLEQIDREYQVLRKGSMSSDPAERQRSIDKLEQHSVQVSAWQEDIETRNEAAQDQAASVLDDQAEFLRGNYTAALGNAQETKRISSEMHTLLADPEFDVNNPLNRARLGALLEQTPREMLADTPGMLDALGGLMGAGEFVRGLAGEEKFKFTKQQWATIAHAMNGASQNRTRQAMQDALEGGKRLDLAGQKAGISRPISYSESIFTGKVQGGRTPDPEGVAAEDGTTDRYQSPKTRDVFGNTESDQPDVLTRSIERLGPPPAQDIDRREDIERRLRERELRQGEDNFNNLKRRPARSVNQ